MASARVILVEDDPAVAVMYRLGLEHHGFDVITVGSGAELFGTLDGTRPDVIVLDYQLPGPNGAEVLEMIRGDCRIKDAQVLMLSNFPPTHDGAVDRVFKFGALAWLEKAKTSPGALALKLTEALSRSRRQA